MSKKKKQATEELVQTQVLNIEEVRRVANYEQKLSKKPAAICAIIGVFMILFGGGAQGYITYNQVLEDQAARQKDIVARKTKTEEESKIIPGDSTLTCTISKQANPDGTNFIGVFTYKFTDSKLKAVSKELMMDGYNETGLITMINQYGAHKTYAALGSTVPGYNIVAGDRGSIGFYVTNVQDLTILNPAMIPEIYSTNIYASVDHKLDTSIEEVEKFITAKQFTCTLTKDTQITQ